MKGIVLKSTIYRTSDMYLAAALMCNRGIKRERIEQSKAGRKTQAIMVMVSDDANIHDMVSAYYKKELTVEPLEYRNMLMDLKDAIHNNYMDGE
jgi:hypothetical protein